MGRRRKTGTQRAPGRTANGGGGAKADDHLHLLRLRGRMLRSRRSKLIHVLEVRRNERDYLRRCKDARIEKKIDAPRDKVSDWITHRIRHRCYGVWASAAEIVFQGPAATIRSAPFLVVVSALHPIFLPSLAAVRFHVFHSN